MKSFFENYWLRSTAIIQAIPLSSAPLTEEHRTLKMAFVKSSDDQKFAIVVYALKDTLSLRRLAVAMRTQSVKVVSDRALMQFLKYSSQKINLLTHLRTIPVLIDIKLISFPAILIHIGKQVIEMDPFQFIQIIKGQLFRISNFSTPNSSNIS